jgi:hypothetical protein
MTTTRDITGRATIGISITAAMAITAIFAGTRTNFGTTVTGTVGTKLVSGAITVTMTGEKADSATETMVEIGATARTIGVAVSAFR